MAAVGDQLLGASAGSESIDAVTGDFRAGFAERDITPRPGLELPGDYGKSFHRAFCDPCKVRAAVFDDGTTTTALVGVDALIIRRPTVQNARRAIRQRCGIAPGAVLVAASHSHSAGPTGMILPGEYDDAPDWVRQLAYEESSCADPQYLIQVEVAVADAVAEAYDRRVPVRASLGSGTEPGVAFNRRFKMADGRTVTHPGQGNPHTVEPAGSTDPQVGVLGAWDARGQLLGCIVHFACHATTMPGGTSADYVCAIERTIRGLLGEQAVVVFLPGASGDVTQVDNRSPHQVPQFGESVTRRVGGRIGAEALKVLLATCDAAGPLQPIRSESRTLPIRRRSVAGPSLARARQILGAQPPPPKDSIDWIFAKETVLADFLIRKAPAVEAEVQVIQVGPAVFLACPGEVFCADGLDLKARSGFPFTFPVALANDCLGYIPPPDAFGPGGGGYETRLTSYSNLEVGASRAIREALAAMARQWAPGPVPTLPPAAPFAGRAWPYGDCGPDAGGSSS